MNDHVYDLLKWSVLSGGNGDGEKINNQDKTITKNGVYAADEGYTGLGTVVVNVSSGGEAGDIGVEKYFAARYAEVSLPNVTAIKDYAFYLDQQITDIYMPKVVRIGSNAFKDCYGLAITSLPSGLNTIGVSAFRSCTKLAVTSLPNVLKNIERYGFYDCPNLALTALPSGLVAVDQWVFYGCTKLQLTSLPSSITSIGSSAFGACTGLTSLTFEGTPTSIANDAFNKCTNLTNINVPWAEGAVSGAPWGATNATINYNYTGA